MALTEQIIHGGSCRHCEFLRHGPAFLGVGIENADHPASRDFLPLLHMDTPQMPSTQNGHAQFSSGHLSKPVEKGLRK
jgi:hypothetical protein